MATRQNQRGGAVAGLIILTVIAYGVYVAFQYVPLYIESSTVDSILHTVADVNNKERLSDAAAVRAAINKQLYVNDMQDLKENFEVVRKPNGYLVTARYERDLNLLFTRKQLPYEKTVVLE